MTVFNYYARDEEGYTRYFLNIFWIGVGALAETHLDVPNKRRLKDALQYLGMAMKYLYNSSAGMGLTLNGHPGKDNGFRQLNTLEENVLWTYLTQDNI